MQLQLSSDKKELLYYYFLKEKKLSVTAKRELHGLSNMVYYLFMINEKKCRYAKHNIVSEIWSFRQEETNKEVKIII